MMTTEKRRNGEIDLLRFVFAVLIVFYHFGMTYGIAFFPNGYIAVEFFFVVSGYLMAANASENIHDPGSIANETWRYLIKKIKGFYLYYICAILLQILVRDIIVNHTGISRIVFDGLKSIPTFILAFTGLNGTSMSLYVSGTWYLSAMMIAIFLLYPVLLWNKSYSLKIVYPFLALFILVYLYETNKTLSSLAWSGLVSFGVLRAAAEMSLGGVIYQISDSELFKRSAIICSDKVYVKAAATFLKVLCYAVVIVFAIGTMFGVDFKTSFDVHALLFCSLGVLLSFSKAGYSVPDCGVTRYLGRISLPVFIFHGFINWTIYDCIGHKVSNGLFALLIVLTVIASVGLMYLIDFAAAELKKAVSGKAEK